MKRDYRINIFYRADDEGYIADLPDWKFCTAFGETPAEASKELETALAEGKLVSEPKYRPVIYQSLVA